MPDRRKHRGPHPEDAELFARQNWRTLQTATDHLCWLLSRDYTVPSALKLVGDRFELSARQRLAIQRCACSDSDRQRRARHHVPVTDVRHEALDIDGFNLLTTIEAALGGGILVRGRDGCLRDMASMHGSYRKVEETRPALMAIGRTLESLEPLACTWWLDRPVSNSGRLGQMLIDLAKDNHWPWCIEMALDPDPILSRSNRIVVSADSVILDRVGRWFDLASLVVSNLSLNSPIAPIGEPVKTTDR